ncbi:GIY-YIG nuclease family protein [Putridiphycobacter roseus]|uniref:GIY-YIG nuclease family protein n=1 Tax=Putridiphycobacter roseus TaxID=2219161 RepID=A0A2W1NFY7_9FLAO|nr:GIY-YIG nuclease family protein [Putridiphycobacter roseus]
MATVYILHSTNIDKFYIGSCICLIERLKDHKSNTFKTAFTHRANDWVVFLQIDNLHYNQARKIENNIKSMKSKKYINNLKNILKSLKN